MANPPYLDAARHRPPPDPAHAAATIEGRAKLRDWTDFCAAMAAPGGAVTLIHRADRLADVLAAFKASDLGGVILFPLWPDEGTKPAKRVLIRGIRASKEPLTITPGLVLHDGQGGYTAGAQAVLADAAHLAL